jgi:tRNA A-37 threonylcarbamoyl transferase component Bud32
MAGNPDDPWSAAGESPQLTPGLELGRFELLCPIARGGMASVWIARSRSEPGLGELVAIKTMLPHSSQDLRSQRMFLDEARITSRIDHGNVARIRDFGCEQTLLYLVLEWVDGDSLSRLQGAVQQKGGQFSPGIALRIVADASAGLHAAHELRDREGAPLGVVHRDVSPQNILVSVDGVAKVIDFGIAKARHRISADTTDGALRGKLLYMAPEQALGREVDCRADVYSLGAVLYHLLAGRPPFSGETEAATFGFITSGLPPPPVPSNIPAPVARVVRKALARVGERYGTAEELRRAIEAAMVESGLTTSVRDVATYLQEHLGDRVAARQAFVHKAVDAAAARAPAPRRERTAVQTDVPGRSAGPALHRRRFARSASLAGALLAVCAGLGWVGITRIGRAHADAVVRIAPAEDHPLPLPPPVAVAIPDTPSPEAKVEEREPPARVVSAPNAGPKIAPLSDSSRYAPPTRSQRATSRECDPPYTVDSGGIRRYKRACLR